MAKARREESTLSPGFWVALTLRPRTAPLRCYVGKVQSVDDHGVRITLVEWLTGTADNYDLFIPWSNLESALIATPDHDLSGFREEASKWQNRMCGDAAEGEEGSAEQNAAADRPRD